MVYWKRLSPDATHMYCVQYITFLSLSVEFQPKIRGVLTEIAKQIVYFSLRAIIS